MIIVQNATEAAILEVLQKISWVFKIYDFNRKEVAVFDKPSTKKALLK